MNFAEKLRNKTALMTLTEILLLPLMILTANLTFNAYVSEGKLDYAFCMAAMCIEFAILVVLDYVAKKDRPVSKSNLVLRVIMRTLFFAIPLNLIATIANDPMDLQSPTSMFFGMIYAFVLITPMFVMTVVYMSKYVKKALSIVQGSAILLTALCAGYLYIGKTVELFS